MNRSRQNRNRTNPYLRRGEGRSRSGTAETAEISPRRRTMADSGKKCRTKATVSGVSNSTDEMPGPRGGSGKAKKLTNKRERSAKKLTNNLLESGNDECNTSVGDGVGEINSGKKCVTTDLVPHNLHRKGKKKRKSDEPVTTVEYESEQQYEKITPSAEPEDHMINLEGPEDTITRRSSKRGKSKRSGKMKKKNLSPVHESSPKNLLERREDEEDEVYEMSSGDEDNSKGMKKWITQYYQSRPGLKVLEERIDDFIMAHEAQEAKARAEREAEAAEGGWTVVVHHKGRKKTTETESGVSVGSVSEAAILDKIGQKKKNDVGLDFYRFQKREAHRNEILTLQSKFEQDKKRIQEMRAARKFRPY